MCAGDTPGGIPVTPDVFRGTVQHNLRARLQRSAEHWSREGRVHDHRAASRPSSLAQRRDISDFHQRIGEGLDHESGEWLSERLIKRATVADIHELQANIKICLKSIEKCPCATV